MHLQKRILIKHACKCISFCVAELYKRTVLLHRKHKTLYNKKEVKQNANI